MPELPEVEILARNLRSSVVRQNIIKAEVFRSRSVWGITARRLIREMTGKRIRTLTRRAKYLRFDLVEGGAFLVHLGMTGRLSFSHGKESIPRAKHDVAWIHLNHGKLVFHDPRKFGHLAWGDVSLRGLGPEPLENEFTVEYLLQQMRSSRSPVKVRLLDQRLVAGIGNIYACEALWRARIDPRLACRRLKREQVASLYAAIRSTLQDAIRFGGGLSLDFGSSGKGDKLFYYGSGARRDNPAEHFDVYDREGKPCRRCRGVIERITQSGRSTFYCPRCQVKT